MYSDSDEHNGKWQRLVIHELSRCHPDHEETHCYSLSISTKITTARETMLSPVVSAENLDVNTVPYVDH